MIAEPRTLNELFNEAVDRFREDEFLRYKKGTDWHSLTYGEVARRVRELALGLSTTRSAKRRPHSDLV